MKQEKLKALLNEMTLTEKVGQMVQLTPNFFESDGEITGPMQEWNINETELFQIGSVLGTHRSEEVIRIQETYLAKSRLKIPLIFMADVIHGYETIFPIPLGLASSFDPDLIEKMASFSAIEAANEGIHVTFSPMSDLVRDARWGRVLESNGEDPYLNTELTKAYVRGYQGKGLEDKNKIAACAKHFIGYGAAEGGRDYNTVDMSTIELYQNYLPSFRGAIDEGVKLVMTSFNTIHGIPATGNKWLLQDVLRKELKFDGMIISDWGSVGELISHRVASSKKEAAKKAAIAGVNMDMMTSCYQKELQACVEEGLVSLRFIDESVLQILQLKNELGLFEDPFRGLKSDELIQQPETEKRQTSREIASQSMVLLKNESILPLKIEESVKLLGNKANNQDVLGAWSWIGNPEKSVTIYEGLNAKMPNITILSDTDVDTIKATDTILVAIGEHSDESGEGASRSNIRPHQEQTELVKQVSKVTKNIILVVINGKPIDLSELEPLVKGILIAWYPGIEAGNSIADILLGKVNPSGKLPMSFPRSGGQLPLYYNHLTTGRPVNEFNNQENYVSRYRDVENDALYPFGYGLSYSQFELKEIIFSQTELTSSEILKVKVRVANKSEISGQAVVQLYIKDLVAEVARPERELKKFTKLFVEKNSEQEIIFELTSSDLAYVHSDLSLATDTGEFEIYIGFDSKAPLAQTIMYKDSLVK